MLCNTRFIPRCTSFAYSKSLINNLIRRNEDRVRKIVNDARFVDLRLEINVFRAVNCSF